VSSVKYWVWTAEGFPVVEEDDMLSKNIDESSEPVEGRLARHMYICTAKASRISCNAAKSDVPASGADGAD
jgi:hypothetical protein